MSKVSEFIKYILLFAVFFFVMLSLATAPVYADNSPAINKYLVANPPTNPNAGTIYSNVTSPATNTTYSYVVSVTGQPGNYTVTDTIPSGFVSSGCVAYVNGSIGPAINCTGPWLFNNVSGNPANITLIFTGQFISHGSITNAASATWQFGTGGPKATSTTEFTSVIATQPPAYDLKVTKTSNLATVANNGIIHYTITVTNNSAVAAPLNSVKLYDKITNPNTGVGGIDFNLNWSNFSCTGTPCFSVPSGWPSSIVGLAPGAYVNIFDSTGITAPANAMLAAGASIKVEYDLTIGTYYACGLLSQLSNSAYLAFGNTSATFPDNNLANNTANKIVTLNIPPACSSIPIAASKTLLSPPAWGIPLTYEITLKNVSNINATFSYQDLVNAMGGTIVFDATIQGAPSCSLNNASTPCNETHPTLTFVGSSPQVLIDNSSQTQISLPSMAVFKMKYQVSYDAVCQAATVKIRNVFVPKVTMLSSTPVIYPLFLIQNTLMPSKPSCKVNATKGWSIAPTTASATTPLTFGSGVLGRYAIKWKNSGASPANYGTLRDIVSINSPLYAAVPVTITPVAGGCTTTPASGTGAPIWQNSTWANTAVANFTAQQPREGIHAIELTNVSMPAGSEINCLYDISVNRPSFADARCQSSGSIPFLQNTALGNVDGAYNPNLLPTTISTTVNTRLPWCRDITVKKVAVPAIVLPSDTMTWTITTTNNGTQSITGPVKVRDNIPSNLLPPNPLPPPSIHPSAGSSCAYNTAFTYLSMAFPFSGSSGLPAGQSFNCSFTSNPMNPGSYTNNANVHPENGSYFHYSDSAPSGSGMGWVAYPVLTKQFSPTAIPPGGVANLIFTITNLSYKPLVAGMGFTDTLPTGLQVVSFGSNTCGGTPSGIGTGSVTLTNATMANGTASCTFTAVVKETTQNKCSVRVNDASNVTVTKLSKGGIAPFDKTPFYAQLQTNYDNHTCAACGLGAGNVYSSIAAIPTPYCLPPSSASPAPYLTNGVAHWTCTHPGGIECQATIDANVATGGSGGSGGSGGVLTNGGVLTHIPHGDISVSDPSTPSIPLLGEVSLGGVITDIPHHIGTTYTVTPSAGPGCTISPNTPQTVVAGSTPSFTITPNPGYALVATTGTCGGTPTTGSPFTTNPVNANCTVIFNCLANTKIKPKGGFGFSIGLPIPKLGKESPSGLPTKDR